MFLRKFFSTSIFQNGILVFAKSVVEACWSEKAPGSQLLCTLSSLGRHLLWKPKQIETFQKSGEKVGTVFISVRRLTEPNN